MDGARILLVEDERVWRRKLRKILEREGYKVETAASYGEALGRLCKESFRLVVTDLRLGPKEHQKDYGGIALLDDAAERQIPTIVVTGYGTVQLARRAYEDYDVLQFLSKGTFEARRFIEIVRQALMPAVPRAAAFLFDQGIIEAIPDDFLEVVSAAVPEIEEERVLALLEQIQWHTRNLNILEGQKVKYGIDVPLHIENGIEYEKAEIRRKEGQIRKLLEEIYRKQLQ
jgi:CheY-like chemotaxis protein